MSGQMPNATANFEVPDIEITTTPEFPGICNPDLGIFVTCNEVFESYTWKLQGSNDAPLEGNPVTLKKTGTWILTVIANIDGRTCSRDHEIKVRDLKDPTEMLVYLREAGFYEVSVIREPPTISPEPETCLLNNLAFNFNDEMIKLDDIMTDVVNNFAPIKGIGGTTMSSNNTCFCDVGIVDLETQFNTGNLKLWVHQFFNTNLTTKGKLFIKARMPFEDALPIPAQKSHLASIHSQILSANSGTSEQGRVIFSNLFMPHPIGGYEPEDLCDLTEPFDPEAFYLSPAGVPIKLPAGSNNEIFTDEENSEGIFEGALTRFNINSTYYHGYTYKENKFAGYFYDIKAEIKDNFESGNNGEITYVIPEIDCNQCYATYGFAGISSGVRLGFSDGGVNSDLWENLENISNFLLTQKEVRETILDLLCALRHGEPTFTFPKSIFSDKILLSKNIELEGINYDYVGISLPPFTGLTINLLTPLLNNSLTTASEGFKDGLQFNSDPQFRISCFTKKCNSSKMAMRSYAFHRNNTNTSPFYIWPKQSKFLLEKKFEPSEINNLALKIYLNKEGSNDNLLIFASGYRMNLSLTTDNPKTQDKLRCSDSYIDSGSYWGGLDNNFIARIGTRNVYYADGHDAITTSNHNAGGNIYASKIKFAESALSSYCAAGKFEAGLEILAKLFGISGVILGNIICEPSDVGNPSSVKLNSDPPNYIGFGDRQHNGYVYGVDLVNKIKAGKVKIKKNANGKVIGKIDIVAHSMGFAYAYGISRALLEDIELGISQLGNFYVLAPENACAAVGINLGKYESIWQYGTAENGPNPHLAWERDGVAPQCAIPGIDWNKSPYGRVRFQGTADFINAHLGGNYGWVLNRTSQQTGYVQSR